MKMEKYTKEEMLEYLNSVAVLKPFPKEKQLGDNKYWASKTDGSYITHENLFMDVSWMKEWGITEEIQSYDPDGFVACIWFNPEQHKWYGWSHRAVYGFGVGSETKIGDCGYQADNEENFIKQELYFWTDGHKEEVMAEKVENRKGEQGIRITWRYSEKTPNEKLRGEVDDYFIPFPKKYGKGEWTANTIEEAKQMAIDFAKSVA